MYKKFGQDRSSRSKVMRHSNLKVKIVEIEFSAYDNLNRMEKEYRIGPNREVAQ